MYPSIAGDKSPNKILLRMPCTYAWTVVKMPCTPQEKFWTKIYFRQVFCFQQQKCSQIPIFASETSSSRRFREQHEWCYPESWERQGDFRKTFPFWIIHRKNRAPWSTKHANIKRSIVCNLIKKSVYDLAMIFISSYWDQFWFSCFLKKKSNKHFSIFIHTISSNSTVLNTWKTSMRSTWQKLSEYLSGKRGSVTLFLFLQYYITAVYPLRKQEFIRPSI